jgi:hypothetical protein
MKVEKGILMPGNFPFAQMEVGDSFVIPSTVRRSSVYIAAKRFADEHGVKFATRKLPDGILRCWRVK